MSRKTFQIISLILVCASMLLIVISTFDRNVVRSSESQPQNGPSDLPEGIPELVIPESPLGTLGFICALAAAFGMFAIIHKRK